MCHCKEQNCCSESIIDRLSAQDCIELGWAGLCYTALCRLVPCCAVKHSAEWNSAEWSSAVLLTYGLTYAFGNDCGQAQAAMLFTP